MTTKGLHVIERRMFMTEFRTVAGSDGRQRWARAVTYGTVDDYGTTWLPGCFNDGLGLRMPTMLYGHDWYDLAHVLGQGIDFKDVRSADEFGLPGCDVLLEFADPEQVPSARLAMVLTSPPNAILRDCSVGFDRQEWLRKDDLTPEQLAMGAEEAMVRAAMDELSIVVRGAVPGASMRGKRSWVIDGKVSTEPPQEQPSHGTRTEVRMGDRTLDLESVITVARAQAAGDLTADEARAALEALAVDEAPDEQRAAPPDSQSFYDLMALVRDAIADRIEEQTGVEPEYLWIDDAGLDWAVYCIDSDYWQVPYTIDAANMVTLGDAFEVTRQTIYTPVAEESGTAGADEGETRSELSDDDVAAVAARAALHGIPGQSKSPVLCRRS